MAGRRQKPIELLVNRRGGRARALTVVKKQRSVPSPPGLGSYARRVWRDFWRSDESSAVSTYADMEQLRHWIRCVDEREKVRQIIAESPLVESSRPGVYVRHPLMVRLNHLDSEIWKAAEHFGMTPLSRFRLQLSYADAGLSLDDLRQRMESSEDDDRVIDIEEL